jgi:WD40 repeat protein
MERLALVLALGSLPVLALTAQKVSAGETKLRTKLVDTFEQGHAGPGRPRVDSLALSPDGTLLASGGSDTTVKLWDVARRRVIATLRGHAKSVDRVAFSADGKTLFSASEGVLKLWDVATAKNVATLNYPHVLDGLAVSPDGKVLAVATGGPIELVDLASRKPIASLGKKGDRYSPNSTVQIAPIAFSADGKTLLVGPLELEEGGPNVRLWDVAGGKLIAAFTIDNQQYNSSLTLSSDGKSVVAVIPSGNTIRIETWDAATGKLKQ